LACRRNGLDLRENEIIKDERRAHPFAILAIAPVNKYAAGHLVQDTLNRVRKMSALKAIFCRPITRDGLRAVEHYGFRIDPATRDRKPGPLHVINLDGPESSKLLSRLQFPS